MANKPARQRVTDADVEAMNEIYRVAEEKTEMKYRDKITEMRKEMDSKVFEAAMGMKYISMDASEAQSRFLRILFLRQIKEKLKEWGKWTAFCQEYNIDQKKADYEIAKLSDFKDEFLVKFGSLVGFDINKIKYLHFADSEKLGVKDNFPTYNGEIIEDVPAFVESLKQAHKKELENLKGDIAAKDRLLKDKDRHAEKLQRQLAKFELDAEGKGLTIEEDAFIQKMQNLRTGFDGYMLRIDPERIEELNNPDYDDTRTARMRAAYLSTLDYMRRQMLAAYDIAVERFGWDMSPEDEGPGFRDLSKEIRD